MSRTVNSSSDLDAEARGAASLAPAVTRAAAIIDALAESPADPTPLSDLARRLGLPKSSVANICGALVEARLIRRAGAGFMLGRRLAELGGAYLATVDQVQEFYELSDQLPVASEETTQMALLDGLEVTYVARHDGRRRGYAIDNEETAEGIVCLGVAIPKRRPGDGLYALSVTLLKARADPGRREALVADLQRLARQLSNPLIVDRAAGDGRIR